MAIAPNTTFVSGAVLTAAQQNAFGFSTVALTTLSTNYAPTTVISDAASVTFTAIANRNYRYSFYVPGADSSAVTLLTLSLTNSANVAVNNCVETLRGAGVLSMFNFVTIRTETAGSITRKIRGVVSTGNGSMFSATSVGYFLVEDIGPA